MSQSSENDPVEYFRTRFGCHIDEIKGMDVEKRSGDYWLVSDRKSEGLETEVSGIRFLRTGKLGLKPTTYALQLLEDHITRNVVDVTKEELCKLLEREEMVEKDLDEEGYVGIRYKESLVGCGYFKNGVVSSRVPKGRSGELSDVLE